MSEFVIAPVLTPHLVLGITSKSQRLVGLGSGIEKYNYQLAIATSVYEAMSMIKQDLPHFVLTESVLPDGTAVDLFDQLRADPILSKIAIIVQVLKKSRAELELAASRKFNAFMLGDLNPPVVLNKLAEIASSFGNTSPFYIDTRHHEMNSDFQVEIQSTIVGQTAELLVCKSDVELDINAKMVINPRDAQRKPILVRSASNTRRGEEHFNLFPKRVIQGPGRLWVEQLGNIELGSHYPPQIEPGRTVTPKQIIYYDKDLRRAGQIGEFLEAYDIAATVTDSLRRVALYLSQREGDLDCVYLQELGTTTADIEFKTALKKLSDEQRPPFVIATSSHAARSTDKVTFLRTPFGLNKLLQAFEMAFVNSPRSIAMSKSIQLVGSGGSYHIVGKLLGISESGGYLRTSFALKPGTRFSISVPWLQEEWAQFSPSFRVTACAVSPVQPGEYHSRFEVLPQGLGRRKFIETNRKLFGA